MLAFYTWDTVHADVRGQHSLDFKGHFIALFRPKNVPDAGELLFESLESPVAYALSVASKIFTGLWVL